jgi:hypothetical protein
MHRLIALGVLLVASIAAAAEIQKQGPEVFPSKHELSAHLGYQAAYGATFQNPSGMKMTAEYAYRFHELAWFDLQVSNVFGFGSSPYHCNGNVDPNAFCYVGGWAFALAGGVKLKWTTSIPLVVEAPILLGVDVLYNRDCGDNGAAGPVVRTGGSAKYFLTRNIGVGAGINFGFGPAFHSSSRGSQCNRDSYTDFYGTFEFAFMAEFIL